MADVFKIKEWDKVFENRRSRQLDKPDYVNFPIARDSDSFVILHQTGAGLLAYGLFMCLVRIAGKCPVRGILEDEKGPWFPARVAKRLKAPETVVVKAWDLLASKEIGWLEPAHSDVRAPIARPSRDVLTPSTRPCIGLERIGLDGIGEEPLPRTPKAKRGDDPPGFAEFWREYPGHRKTARAQCAAKWAALTEDFSVIMQGLAAWKASADWAKNGGEFIPAPLVWLNQTRWTATPRAAGSAPTAPSSVSQMLAGLNFEEEK